MERAVKLSSKFRTESPCAAVKQELTSIIDYSNAEKLELDKLNSKMSAYITKVKNLELENKRLITEIDETKQQWGNDTVEVNVILFLLDTVPDKRLVTYIIVYEYYSFLSNIT